MVNPAHNGLRITKINNWANELIDFVVAIGWDGDDPYVMWNEIYDYDLLRQSWSPTVSYPIYIKNHDQARARVYNLFARELMRLGRGTTVTVISPHPQLCENNWPGHGCERHHSCRVAITRWGVTFILLLIIRFHFFSTVNESNLGCWPSHNTFAL